MRGVLLFLLCILLAAIIVGLLSSCSPTVQIQAKCWQKSTEGQFGSTKYLFLTSDSLIMFIKRSFDTDKWRMDTFYVLKVKENQLYTQVKNNTLSKKQPIKLYLISLPQKDN